MCCTNHVGKINEPKKKGYRIHWALIVAEVVQQIFKSCSGRADEGRAEMVSPTFFMATVTVGESCSLAPLLIIGTSPQNGKERKGQEEGDQVPNSVKEGKQAKWTESDHPLFLSTLSGLVNPGF